MGFGELYCAVSGTLKNNASMPTTAVDRWKIFLLIISILNSVHRTLLAACFQRPRAGFATQSMGCSTGHSSLERSHSLLGPRLLAVGQHFHDTVLTSRHLPTSRNFSR
jgi:hypothetical protein